MLLRRKLRTKLIILVILALLFIYWRGMTSLLVAQKGWNCQYHVVYALCEARNNKASLPGIIDILKAGVKF